MMSRYTYLLILNFVFLPLILFLVTLFLGKSPWPGEIYIVLPTSFIFLFLFNSGKILTLFGALSLLFCIPLLIIGKEHLADRFASIAFFFFFFGVVKNLARLPEGGPKDELF